MRLEINEHPAEILRETLQHALHELRIESARADSHAFREMLHRRERSVEAVLTKLGPAQPS